MSIGKSMFLVYFVCFSGCAVPQKERRLSDEHPADPAAPEAQVRFPAGTTGQSEATGGTTAPSAGAAATRGAERTGDEGVAESQAAVYTCPMHPEVRQPRPGRCPKCGMTLVKGKGEDKSKADQP